MGTAGEMKTKKESSEMRKGKGSIGEAVHQEDEGLLDFLRRKRATQGDEKVSLIGMFRLWKEKRAERGRKFITYETVVFGGMPSREFYVLLVLSCLIATMGLYQDSAATIIGAMIVAPLMGPILAFSAGLFSAKADVIVRSLLTLAKGTVIVLGLTALLTWAIPFVTITGEMLKRTGPGFADIVVALACGAVGAYAYANTRVSAALPGVAISVALMPPLCTVGIGLGKGDMALAGGAALLFLINLVGIALASAVVFYMIRLSPDAEDAEGSRIARKRLLSHIGISVVLLAAISVPLFLFAIRSIGESTRRQVIARTLHQAYPDGKLHSLVIEGDTVLTVDAIVLGGTNGRAAMATLDEMLTAELGVPVHIRIYPLYRQSP